MNQIPAIGRRVTWESLSEQEQALVVAAEAVRANAYAPYSRFKVGAAVQATDGSVHVGCNVENGSFGATICAERAAVGAAVANGTPRLVCVAITATTDEPCPPCGICRQTLTEFGPHMTVLLVSESREIVRVSMAELLPVRFRSEIFLGVEPIGSDDTQS